METLITIVNIIIFGLIISSPILLLVFLNKRNSNRLTFKYFFIGIFIMAFLMLIFAGWGQISSFMLLNNYGYSVDGMNYENVLPENRERVDMLVTSIMGIGWPLIAIFSYAMIIPYLLFVYFGKVLFDRIKER